MLISAGNVKRDRISSVKEELISKGEKADEAAISEQLDEQEVGISFIIQLYLLVWYSVHYHLNIQ